MNTFRGTRRDLRRLEEKDLKNEQLNYDNGLSRLEEFLTYIQTFAIEYKKESHNTVRQFGDFLRNITEDKENFEADYTWLNTTATIKSAKELEDLSYTIEEVNKKLGISNDNMEQMRKAIKAALHEIRGWSIGSATVSGILSHESLKHR